MTKVKILCDNTSVKTKIMPDWGFAALIEHRGHKILFDTGGDAQVLAANMKAMGLEPKQIEIIVIPPFVRRA